MSEQARGLAKLGFNILTGGPSTFVVGCERLPDGALKVYVGHRYKNIYTVIEDEDAAAEVERAWGNAMQHVLIPLPPADALFQDEAGEAQ